MPYTKKSIGQPAGGAGNPSPKSPSIIVVEAADIKDFPVRERGKTVYDTGFTLKEGAVAIGIYATPASIEMLQQGEGEPDAFGFRKGVKFSHPGNSAEIEDFAEYIANRGTVAIVTACTGGAARIVGSPCNPLSTGIETTDTKDANNSTFTLQQAVRDEFRIMRYTGTLPPIAEPASSDDDA